MKVKIHVSPDEEIGPLADHEKAALAKLREYFADYDIPDHSINTTRRGWIYSQEIGAQFLYNAIISSDKKNPHPLSRLMPVVYPWVPSGEPWGPPEDGDTYHTSWKIDFRAMNPLEEA